MNRSQDSTTYQTEKYKDLEINSSGYKTVSPAGEGISLSSGDKTYIEKTVEGRVEDAVKNLEITINDKFEKSRLDSVSVIGIFIGIFTFISVSIQVFESAVSAYQLIGLTLVFLGSLTTLVLVIDVIINRPDKSALYINNNEKRGFRNWIKSISYRVFIFTFCFFTLLFGLLFTIIDTNTKNNLNNEIRVNDTVDCVSNNFVLVKNKKVIGVFNEYIRVRVDENDEKKDESFSIKACKTIDKP